MTLALNINNLPTLVNKSGNRGGVQVERSQHYDDSYVLYLRAGDRWEGNGTYLTRADAGKVIDKLQEFLDAAGPEPVLAPECDYLRDIDGDKWVLCDDGFWGMTEHVVPREGSRDFADLLDAYGPLTPYREVTKVEALPTVSK